MGEKYHKKNEQNINKQNKFFNGAKENIRIRNTSREMSCMCCSDQLSSQNPGKSQHAKLPYLS
ncbi:MAG: hypothetical protein NPIRA06_16290 [Nitrospirales bacterium]|nr:MAG: hypothetical protein NPIRA06_16290 [Nitrospirales bacterium]